MNALVTNDSNISLALCVWLLGDNYDYITNPDYSSATGLMKPTRQVILETRLGDAALKPDVKDYVPRALGNAIHDSIEKSWKHNFRGPLKLLGYPDDVINRILINPSDAELEQTIGAIPIYLEIRGYRVIDGHTVGGKFDMVADGLLNDTKSTSVYAWIHGTKDEDYRLQGSIYKWIDAARPKPWITEDYIRINFVFTDWKRGQVGRDPKYPQAAVQHKDIPLMTLQETENWIRARIRAVKQFAATDEKLLPECTDEELWRSDPQFKYYKDPAKLERSTRNFTLLSDAKAFQAEKGGVGVIKTIPGEPKRCSYCKAFPICSQKDKYFGNS